MKTGRGPKAITSAKSIQEAERRAEIMTMRLDGLTLEQIGQRMGIKADTVHGIITRALTAMTKEPSEELLALELGRCDVLLNEAMATVKAFHPLVSGGRVVSAPMLSSNGEPVRDAETGEVVQRVLEDKVLKLAAISTAVRVMERRSKLLGLDAPIRAQQELTVTSQQAEPQDLTKLNDNDLSLYGYLIEKLQADKTDDGARDVKAELSKKLSPGEIWTLQEIFRKLDVQFIHAQTVQGLYSGQPRLPSPQAMEARQ